MSLPEGWAITETAGISDRRQDPLRDLVLRLIEPRVDRCYDDVEPCQRFVGEVEPAVGTDIDLCALQDPETCMLPVFFVDQLYLAGKSLFIQSVSDAEAFCMVRHRDILVSFLDCRQDDCAEVVASVRPFRMDMEVAFDIVNRDELRQLPRKGRFDFSLVLAQFRRNKGEFERRVNVLLLFSSDLLFSGPPEHAVFIDLEPGPHCHFPEPDVMLLASGKVLERRPEGILFHDPEVHLDAVIGDDRRLRRSLHQDAVHVRQFHEGVHDRLRASSMW